MSEEEEEEGGGRRGGSDLGHLARSAAKRRGQKAALSKLKYVKWLKFGSPFMVVTTVIVGVIFLTAVVPSDSAEAVTLCDVKDKSQSAAASGDASNDDDLSGVAINFGGDLPDISQAQFDNIRTIVGVGKGLGVPQRGWVAAVMAARQESTYRNLDGGMQDSLGLFQQRPSMDWGTAAQLRDPVYAATAFYTGAGSNPGLLDVKGWESMSLNDAVQKVQGSNTPNAYGKWESEALQFVAMNTDAPSIAGFVTDNAFTLAAPATTTGSPSPGVRTPGGRRTEIDASAAPASSDRNCETTTADAAGVVPATGTGDTFDAGNIISDDVFYNTGALDEAGVRDFVNKQGASCSVSTCLKSMRFDAPAQPQDAYCKPFAGGSQIDAASVIYQSSVACGINPQVMLTTLQKESRLLDRADPTLGTYQAAFGYNCPDTGPGGTANCAPADAGFVNQTYKMAKQWSRYKNDIPKGKYNYHVGAYDINYQVVEAGCDTVKVDIKNLATASLYNYTPYTPNAASLAAYPGAGDKCSAYGNRNFFFMFRKYFGSTGGGTSAGTGTFTGSVARMVELAQEQYGKPYAWGGGNASGPTFGIKDGQFDDRKIFGFDCSGFAEYLFGKGAGISIGGDSRTQYTSTKSTVVPGTSQARDLNALIALLQPGDLLFWGDNAPTIHHVAVYKGNGFMMEAQGHAVPVKESPVRIGGGKKDFFAATRPLAGAVPA